MKETSFTRPVKKRSLGDSIISGFEWVIPDPFVLAILVTIAVAAGAYMWAPNSSLPTMIIAWKGGFFDILTFTLQMILVLATGHAFAHAPLVQKGLRSLVGIAKTPSQAAVLTFLCVALASILNFGVGLVISALLAREVAKRMKVDFAWIVAVGYSGWLFWGSGFSSAIALAQATPGNPMNIVEKMTGRILPFSEMIFTPWNIVPTALTLIIVPAILILLKPGDNKSVYLKVSEIDESVESRPTMGRKSLAQFLEYSPLCSAFIGVLGLSFGYLVLDTSLPFSDVNAIIFVMFVAGVILHGYPLAYANAIKRAANQTGSMMLQFPLYGGIMGIMHATGLPGVIAEGFVHISSAQTLPFWTYLCSLFVTILVPSGGGHWALQGPFAVSAAVTLHANIPATTMAVAFGEQVSNMLQPFWAAPVVAMAGVGVPRVLAFTLVTFVIAAVIYGACLLILV